MYSKKCNINFQKSSISLYKYGIIKENEGEKCFKRQYTERLRVVLVSWSICASGDYKLLENNLKIDN